MVTWIFPTVSLVLPARFPISVATTAKPLPASPALAAYLGGDDAEVVSLVTDAVQNIAEATQDTTNISSKIMDSIEVVSDHVSEVSDMSASQQQIADNLAETVGRFKL